MSTRGTFFGIEIGRTGLSTAQFGLDVTGHNIANVDTAGYTRQRIVQTAYDPYSTIGRFAPLPGHQLVGGGTRVQILDQIRSAYLDRRFRTESTTHAYWESRTQSLSYVESFFDNVNELTSINYSMAEFFRSMKILAEDPISGAPRTLMQTTAMDLVQQLNMIHQGLIDLQESENRSVKTKVSDINLIVQDIIVLNKSIYEFEVTGLIANDLRDKRNLLVDQLAEYIDIEYEEYPDPSNPKLDLFRIYIPAKSSDSSNLLVNHDYSRSLGVREEPNPIAEEAAAGKMVNQVYWIKGYEADGTPRWGDAINWDNITGGQIKAHIDVRDGNGINEALMQWDPDSRSRGIPYYVEMINDLARALVKEINDIHIQGWSDNPLGSKSGIFFFNEDPAWTTWIDNTDPANPVDYTYQPVPAGDWDEFGNTISLAGGEYTYTDTSTGDSYVWNAVTGQWEDALGVEPPITPDANGIVTFPDGSAYKFDAAADGGAGAWREWDANAGEMIPAWTDGTDWITQDPLTGAYLLNGAPLDFSVFTRNVDLSEVTAKSIMLSNEIKDSPYNIACSSKPIDRAASDDPELTQRHNNEIIKELYNLFSRTDVMIQRTDVIQPRVIGSFDDYGTVIRFDLGNTLHTAKQTGETCRLLTLAAENQRTSIAGVSLDEEMVGLVKYQHAYNGASRVITAVDEALDRLINGTGRVGL